MSSLSTHVLDTARGEPAAGVTVTLHTLSGATEEQVTDADGRARFHAVEHRGPAEVVDGDYPVHLTTGRVLAQYQSGAQTRRIGDLPDDGAFAEMHPLLANRLGVADGMPVTVATRRGEMRLPARVTTTIRPDTVFVPFHWLGVNRLVNDALDPASRMPEFKVCAARVVAA